MRKCRRNGRENTLFDMLKCSWLFKTAHSMQNQTLWNVIGRGIVVLRYKCAFITVYLFHWLDEELRVYVKEKLVYKHLLCSFLIIFVVEIRSWACGNEGDAFPVDVGAAIREDRLLRCFDRIFRIVTAFIARYRSNRKSQCGCRRCDIVSLKLEAFSPSCPVVESNFYFYNFFFPFLFFDTALKPGCR